MFHHFSSLFGEKSGNLSEHALNYCAGILPESHTGPLQIQLITRLTLVRAVLQNSSRAAAESLCKQNLTVMHDFRMPARMLSARDGPLEARVIPTQSPRSASSRMTFAEVLASPATMDASKPSSVDLDRKIPLEQHWNTFKKFRKHFKTAQKLY